MLASLGHLNPSTAVFVCHQYPSLIMRRRLGWVWSIGMSGMLCKIEQTAAVARIIADSPSARQSKSSQRTLQEQDTRQSVRAAGTLCLANSSKQISPFGFGVGNDAAIDS